MILKVIITIGLVALIAYFLDFDKAANVMLQASIPLLLLALVAQTISTLIAGFRWGLIMRKLEFDRPLSFYLKVYFIGSYFNQALPSSIGGDAVRIHEVGRCGYRKRSVFIGVLIDRAIGVFGLLVLNLAASLTFVSEFPEWLVQLIYLITASGIVAFLSLILISYLKFFDNFFMLRQLRTISCQAHKLYANLVTLILHTALSIGSHVFSILAVFTIGRALGMDLDYQLFLIAMPPIFLLTFVPISLAGWGIREGAMVGLFMLVGADKSQILAVSILYGITLIVSSLPGGLFWLDSKHHREQEVETI